MSATVVGLAEKIPVISTGTEISFRQLLPERRDFTLAELREALADPGPLPPERPYTFVNFVASVDGRATISGRSAPLSDPGDRALFHVLREAVDAVLAGTQTLRVERYGRMVKNPDARKRRSERGLDPEPLAVVVSRSGQVPYEIPLFSEPEARIVEFTGATAPRPVAARRELVSLDPEEVTLTRAMRELRTRFDARTLLCEGGPTLFGSLVAEGLVDELFLTLSPKLVGGEENPAIVSGPPLPQPAELTLRWVLERESSLFLRFAVRR
jgi:riboflavin-specific deaminase-like protein